MVDLTDNSKHIKDQSTDTEGYLEYTKEKEKGKENQLDAGNKKTNTVVVLTIQGHHVKTARTNQMTNN